MKLQSFIDPGNIPQHLTFTLAEQNMKSLMECVLLCSPFVTVLINSFSLISYPSSKTGPLLLRIYLLMSTRC